MLPYEKPVRFYENLSDNVFLLKLIPGISPVLLPAIFEHYDAIIVESFGVGGIPASIKEPFYELLPEVPGKTHHHVYPGFSRGKRYDRL